jgi:hypothetical protein
MCDRLSNNTDENNPSNAPNKSPNLLTRTRSFSASDSLQFKDLIIEKPKSYEIINTKSVLYPGTNTPSLQKPKSRKRAFSDTEIGELAEILKDYQDFTPLEDKKDIISTRLKRQKVIQKEIAKLTCEISSVQIEKEDSMNL